MMPKNHKKQIKTYQQQLNALSESNQIRLDMLYAIEQIEQLANLQIKAHQAISDVKINQTQQQSTLAILELAASQLVPQTKRLAKPLVKQLTANVVDGTKNATQIKWVQGVLKNIKSMKNEFDLHVQNKDIQKNLLQIQNNIEQDIQQANSGALGNSSIGTSNKTIILSLLDGLFKRINHFKNTLPTQLIQPIQLIQAINANNPNTANQVIDFEILNCFEHMQQNWQINIAMQDLTQQFKMKTLILHVETEHKRIEMDQKYLNQQQQIQSAMCFTQSMSKKLSSSNSAHH
jgi:hypothetical protein